MTAQTPRSQRFQVHIIGRRNAGKSTLINALTRQTVSLVSPVPGTTTDPVRKSVELPFAGPAVLVDTAGIDDVGELGQARLEATARVLQQADLVLFVRSASDPEPAEDGLEAAWMKRLAERRLPWILVLNEADARPADPLISEEDLVLGVDPGIPDDIAKRLAADGMMPPTAVTSVNAASGAGINRLLAVITKLKNTAAEEPFILGGLIRPGELVLMVMPQDKQAPKGRLILPQVQTLRELLDRHCMTLCVSTEELPAALAALKGPPALIITDSQVFTQVLPHVPAETRLTSFSVLFAAYKGDGAVFAEGAKHLRKLTPNSRILIAEACTHRPMNEDIGRVQLPRLLERELGPNLQISYAQGENWPQDLHGIDLVIHCGACMFGRTHVQERLRQLLLAGVPITNYGMAIAELNQMLEHVSIPGTAASEDEGDTA